MPARRPTKTGEEPFHRSGSPLGHTVKDFWRWSGSDLLGNTMRGRLAEYIVAQALGIAEGARDEWSAFDLKLPEGIRVEVKASAYIQTWAQSKLSRLSFGISPTRAWHPETGVLDSEVKRQADVYVFAVHTAQDQGAADPLDVSQWDFYILPTAVLNDKVPKQKRIGLDGLRRLGARQVAFHDLEDAVRLAASLVKPR